MTGREYDMVFVGGGLAAISLLTELLPSLPERVAIIDPEPPPDKPPVHWSYWSAGQTPYDGFSVATWHQARIGNAPPQPIAPYTLRLVRSVDVFAHATARLEEATHIEWLRATAHSIAPEKAGAHEVSTDAGAVRARWVFDSACGVAPTFPCSPRAVLSGTGLRVEADRPVFDARAATLFDPIDDRSFAYLLPLSPTGALVESASFGPGALGEDRAHLIGYLESRHPETDFTVTHSEYGEIPLGFAPPRTAGPRHVLIGTKRGMVKPSAGYGMVRITNENRHLARLWREKEPPPPVREPSQPWRSLDTGFLRLAAQDPRLPMALLDRVMRAVPLAQSLGFMDESLTPRQLIPLIKSAAPVMLRKHRKAQP